MIRVLFVLCVFVVFVATTSLSQDRLVVHITNLEDPAFVTYYLSQNRRIVGHKEISNTNRSPIIDSAARLLKIPYGSPWCLSIQYYLADLAAKELSIVNPMTPTASTYIYYNIMSKNAYKTLYLNYSMYNLKVGDQLLYRLDYTQKGHINVVDSIINRRMIVTIGGNESDRDPSSRTGGMMVKRNRIIDPVLAKKLPRLRLRGVIRFEYKSYQ